MRYKPSEACSTVGCNNPKAKLAKPIKVKKKTYEYGAFCTSCQAIEDKDD